MCSYIVEKAKLFGTAKGPGSAGWRIDTANVYYDHPYEAQLDHALCVDFICEADGGRERVAVEISRGVGARADREDQGGACQRRHGARQGRGVLAGRVADGGGEAVLGGNRLKA